MAARESGELNPDTYFKTGVKVTVDEAIAYVEEDIQHLTVKGKLYHPYCWPDGGEPTWELGSSENKYKLDTGPNNIMDNQWAKGHGWPQENIFILGSELETVQTKWVNRPFFLPGYKTRKSYPSDSMKGLNCVNLKLYRDADQVNACYIYHLPVLKIPFDKLHEKLDEKPKPAKVNPGDFPPFDEANPTKK